MTKQTSSLNSNTPQEADRVVITYYTDPLCCWSWALEPQWRKLQLEYAEFIQWRYVMGGLLPDWKTYHDAEHAVSKPIQMGPVWMHAAQLSGMPMHNRVWMENPPASSYPACIAFACAAIQGDEAAEVYLRLLRSAIMIEGKNIADQKVLLEIAAMVAQFVPTFDEASFEEQLTSQAGIDAFRIHLTETQNKGIQRFPTLIFRLQETAYILNGYQPYQQLKNLLHTLQSTIQPRAFNIQSLAEKSWLQLTPREMQELGLVSETV